MFETMRCFGRILRTQEQVDASVIHFPFTRNGLLLAFVVQSVAFIVLIGGLEICQAAGSCSRDTWNEGHWGVFSEPGWCEKSRPDRLVGEPMNGYSNFWFCYCGSWVAVIGVADYLRDKYEKKKQDTPYQATPRNHLLAAPYLSLVYGFGLWFAGIGSFLFHSFNTPYTLILDLSGANVLLANIGFFSLLPYFNLQWNYWLLTAIRVIGSVVGFSVAMVLGYERVSHEILIPVAVCLAFLEQMVHISLRMAPGLCGYSCTLFSENQIAWQIRRISYGFLAIVVGIIGMICQESVVDLPCDRFSAWQFHAAWHALMASSATLYYVFVRSEHIDYRSDLDEDLLAKLTERSKYKSPIVCGKPYLNISAVRDIDTLSGNQKIDL